MQRLWLLSEGPDIVGGILGSSEVVLWVVGLAGWLVFRGQEMCRWSGFRSVYFQPQTVWCGVFSSTNPPVHGCRSNNKVRKCFLNQSKPTQVLRCNYTSADGAVDLARRPQTLFLNTVVHICVQVCVHLCFQLFKLRDEQVVFLHWSPSVWASKEGLIMQAEHHWRRISSNLSF